MESLRYFPRLKDTAIFDEKSCVQRHIFCVMACTAVSILSLLTIQWCKDKKVGVNVDKSPACMCHSFHYVYFAPAPPFQEHGHRCLTVLRIPGWLRCIDGIER
ncbi:unnamed protein product [Clavelina lepadiformis]|uniref:Uncharacterized protein n=1 Tax=Clavelina lepadiformis TaxID=159417 RepID=A0ABP0EZF4_CLALP